MTELQPPSGRLLGLNTAEPICRGHPALQVEMAWSWALTFIKIDILFYIVESHRIEAASYAVRENRIHSLLDS